MIVRRTLEDLALYTRELHSRGWVANHDGNISMRDEDGRFVTTPTAISKRLIQADDLLVISRAGKVLRGKHRLFSEWSLHRCVYAARPDVNVVMHAHPPMASGFALACAELGPPASAEVVVSLGAQIPNVPFFAPGSDELEHAVADCAERNDVMLLEQHGVLVVGDDLEQAYLRLELLEHYAHQVWVARQLGGPNPLASQHLPTLLAARTKAGLGPEARGN